MVGCLRFNALQKPRNCVEVVSYATILQTLYNNEKHLLHKIHKYLLKIDKYKIYCKFYITTSYKNWQKQYNNALATKCAAVKRDDAVNACTSEQKPDR